MVSEGKPTADITAAMASPWLWNSAICDCWSSSSVAIKAESVNILRSTSGVSISKLPIDDSTATGRHISPRKPAAMLPIRTNSFPRFFSSPRIYIAIFFRAAATVADITDHHRFQTTQPCTAERWPVTDTSHFRTCKGKYHVRDT